MANKHATLAALFTDISDAIREKTGDTASIIADDFPDVIRNSLQVKPFKPDGASYLTFSSPNSFTLKVNDTTKHWNGTLEYFASNRTWTTWDGTTTLSSATKGSDNVLYLRGTGNTVITGSSSNYGWVLTGSDISCIGNIENLLDYATVKSGAHPTMANYCYAYMFHSCSSLTQAPALSATTLADYCYYQMFHSCSSLTKAPALPATTLSNYCYYGMFQNCTSLTQVPTLPAITLANSCYKTMFRGCTALTQAPTLPATTLETYCYQAMFSGCTSLTQAPALPATTLALYCYAYMFNSCSSLTQVPALPATKLTSGCYSSMFEDCTSIKLSSTKTGEYTVAYRIPTTGTGTTANGSLTTMFYSTGGTFTKSPSINTTYYLSNTNTVIQLISFMIEGTSYQAEEGMTWEQWVNSDYNTIGAIIQNDLVVDSSGKYVLDTVPSSSQTIDNGGFYGWGPMGP